MAEASNSPHEISYQEICYIAGKLYLESKYENERLSSILLELQKKLANEQQERLKLEGSLKESSERLNLLENQVKRIK